MAVRARVDEVAGITAWAGMLRKKAFGRFEYRPNYYAQKQLVGHLAGYDRIARLPFADGRVRAYRIDAGAQATWICWLDPQKLLLPGRPGGFIKAYGSNLVPFAIYSGALQTNGELLTLLTPLNPTSAPVVIDRVRYGAKLPWPTTNTGLALQLIDAAQENARVGNWTLGAASPGETNPTAKPLPAFPNLWIGCAGGRSTGSWKRRRSPTLRRGVSIRRNSR